MTLSLRKKISVCLGKDSVEQQPPTWALLSDSVVVGHVYDDEAAQSLATAFASSADEFRKNALRVESRIGELTINEQETRMLHALLGKMDELGELANQFKRHWFYGEELDLTNIDEEVGDDGWYTSLLVDARGTTFAQIFDKNTRKLSVRYPDGEFDKQDAVVRDREAERKELES